MFDLNEAIGDWRESLAMQGTLGRADLDELESHLREEVDQLAKAGISQEEAFAQASQRIGDPASLAQEFGKVNLGRVWHYRMSALLIGMLVYPLIFHAPKVFTYILTRGVYLSFGLSDIPLALIRTIAFPVFFFLPLLIVFWMARSGRLGPCMVKLRERLPLTLATIVLLPLFIGGLQIAVVALVAHVHPARHPFHGLLSQLAIAHIGRSLFPLLVLLLFLGLLRVLKPFDVWRRAVPWVFAGILSYPALAESVNLTSLLFAWGAFSLDARGRYAGIALLLSNLFLALGLAYAIWRAHRREALYRMLEHSRHHPIVFLLLSVPILWVYPIILEKFVDAVGLQTWSRTMAPWGLVNAAIWSMVVPALVACLFFFMHRAFSLKREVE